MTAEVTVAEPLATDLASRIALRTARVAGMGPGYVGPPLAETFAPAGYPVTGFDIDPDKVRLLRTGRSHIGHIPAERGAALARTERFEPTCDPHALRDADAVIVCVPTPLRECREPDLSYVVATAETIRRHLR